MAPVFIIHTARPWSHMILVMPIGRACLDLNYITRFYVLLYSISVISGRWEDDYEILCAKKHCLGSDRPQARPEPAIPLYEIWSVNNSALMTQITSVACMHNLQIFLSISVIFIQRQRIQFLME